MTLYPRQIGISSFEFLINFVSVKRLCSIRYLVPQGVAVLLRTYRTKQKKRRKNKKDLYPKRKKKRKCSPKAFSIRSSTFIRIHIEVEAIIFRCEELVKRNITVEKKRNRKQKKKGKRILLYRRIRAKFNEYIRATCQWTR